MILPLCVESMVGVEVLQKALLVSALASEQAET